MKKFSVVILTASIMSVPFFHSSTLGEYSLLTQIVPIITASKKNGSSVINDNVTIIDKNRSSDISDFRIADDQSGNIQLTLNGFLSNSINIGTILYMLPGDDIRFPLGFSGKIIRLTDNIDGTKNVMIEDVSYADIVQKSSFDMNDITLDASNFIGVIAPLAIESASPMPMLEKIASNDGIYSFRNGAVVVRRASASNERKIFSATEGSAIDAGIVSLNMKVDLVKMGIDASEMSPIDTKTSVGFIVTGSLSKIKLTNKHDIDILGGGIKSLDLHIDGDLSFDVRFNGKGNAKFGYFSEAWNEVKKKSLSELGIKAINAELTGLSSDDKIGKYPLAGLVWSVPCPLQSPCFVRTGNTQAPLMQAKALGVIVWVCLTATGEFSLDGNLTLAYLNPAGLSIGVRKQYGDDFQMINSLQKRSSSGRLMEMPRLNGTLNAQVTSGITTDVDFFASGVRIVNAGIDIATRKKMSFVGSGGYGTDNFNSSWSWNGNVCRKGDLGAGAVIRGSVGFGIKLDTAWKAINNDVLYKFQLPTDIEMNQAGWHGAWYTKLGEDTCAVKTVTSLTGRTWMDRNLGASRVATSIDDITSEVFGDLYQWGRGTDGHEKRTSEVTGTASHTDNPGHGYFILPTNPEETTGRYIWDWRDPKNDNLWQGSLNNPCPPGFRIPTAAEWQAEVDSWSSKNAAGAFASPLKLVAAGYRPGGEEGGPGCYWSSTIENIRARSLGFSDSGGVSDEGFAETYFADYRTYGMSVRCIKE